MEINTMNNLKNCVPFYWVNKNKVPFQTVKDSLELNFEDIIDAEKRLERFAPLIKKLFPETTDGIIESGLRETPALKEALEKFYSNKINGRLFMKCDNYLKVVGSIKARGGIYEVLKHAETLVIKYGLLNPGDDYSVMASEKFKIFFSKFKIAVGSTGNLGMSIGIISATLGFKVYVHMSQDAKEWKKKLLREKGVTVIEYEGDYGKAVEEGRKTAAIDPDMHFVDDENSKELFLGYAVAALRLKKQLEENKITIDNGHQMYVYLPCGVGGAPGGITFGLKHVFGDNVHCIFVEPTHAPCMLTGLETQKFDEISVEDIGIELKTEADGLAVGRPSKLVCRVVDKLLDGEYTIEDEELFPLLYLVGSTEKIKVEPSGASAIKGAVINEAAKESDIHISWLTGGLFVPDELYNQMYERGNRSF